MTTSNLHILRLLMVGVTIGMGCGTPPLPEKPAEPPRGGEQLAPASPPEPPPGPSEIEVPSPVETTPVPTPSTPEGETQPEVASVPDRRMYGVLQPDPARAATDFEAGIRLRPLALRWSRFEPAQGTFSAEYVQELRFQRDAMLSAGFEIVLDFGMQYPPGWVFTLPHSRYRNQFGDEYVGPVPGANGVNAVFNAQIRDAQARYVSRVFQELGTDFFAVRLGWGYYGELNLPSAQFNGRSNCYWAYDDLAMGKAPGLPEGLAPNPVPTWTPGIDDGSAAAFIDWYIGALGNYHDWQISTVRRSFPGKLFMLYPSWGIRPRQIEAAVAGALSGTTSAERNGELQRGFDFARFIAGIRDRTVIPYTTWLDAPFGDDASTDAAQWSPGHYLAFWAQRHPLRLRVWGENTGRNDSAGMARCFDRMKAFELDGLFWAFESQLYSGEYATIAEYAQRIAENP